MYIYKAKIVSVYDGDTVRADIDLGFWSHLHSVQLRLYGINTPELRGETSEAGFEARTALRDMILNKPVTIKTHKDKQEKYGRFLAEIYLGDGGIYVNKWMIDNGYAVAYMA